MTSLILKAAAAAVLLALGQTDSGSSSNNLLLNGDFADGSAHWDGDGRAPEVDPNASPFDNQTPKASVLLVHLKDDRWSKVEQKFACRTDHVTYLVKYTYSSDLAFSTRDEDYKDVPAHIDYNGWRPFDIKPNSWFLMLSDLDPMPMHAIDSSIPFEGGGSFPLQTTGQMEITKGDNKTFCLAFPPGVGTVSLVSVVITDTGEKP